MAAYCTASDVALYLGVTLTTNQTTEATALAEAASDHVDRRTGRSWVSGTVTGEVQTVRDGMIRLDRRPISGVTSLAVRAVYLGASSSVLTAPTGYEIINAAEGQLLVGAADGALATVTYTSAPTVPDDIKQAVVMLAAHWLGATLNSTILTTSELQAGSAKLTFRDDEEPPRVKTILDSYTAAIMFA